MDIKIYADQAINMGNKLLNTIPFIINNRLWSGFLRHKLVLIVCVILGIAIPYSIFQYLGAKISTFKDYSVEHQSITSTAMNNSISFQSLFDGGNKYLVLILIQMLVVYFSNKTIEHLSNVRIHMSVKEMIMSQIRIIIVSLRNWIFELVIGVGVSIVIGVFGPDWLEDILKFVVGCYFVGYLFIDNYNFAFNINIKESTQIVRRHAGAALTVGLVAKILFLLPVLGSLLVSFICSVGATWYMHTSHDQNAGNEAFTYE